MLVRNVRCRITSVRVETMSMWCLVRDWKHLSLFISVCVCVYRDAEAEETRDVVQAGGDLTLSALPSRTQRGRLSENAKQEKWYISASSGYVAVALGVH